MKVNLLAYAITGVIAVAAGVAIAGLPSDPADTIVVDPGSVTTTVTSIPVVTTGSPAPATDPVETDPVTTPAPTSTTSTTTATTSIAPTTSPTATTSEATTTTSEPPLRAPSSISIAVVNATNVGGVAGDLADALEPLGYSQINTADSLPAEETAVYAAEGYEREAQQLLVDAELDDAPILPIDEAPEITANGDFQLILVLGLDAV